MTTISRRSSRQQNKQHLEITNLSDARPRRQCGKPKYVFSPDLDEIDETVADKRQQQSKLRPRNRSKTPPNRQHYQKNPTTPEHKTDNDDTNAQTPSRLLQKLAINSPKTKTLNKRRNERDNRDTIEGSPPKLKRTETNEISIKKELFNSKNRLSTDEIKENCKNHAAELNNRLINGITPLSGDLIKENLLNCKTDVYINARKALHSSYPTEMPGRGKEIEILKDFIRRHLNERNSGSLYVSGPPGTGKTASLNLILQQDGVGSRLKHVYINCTTIKSSSSIFSKISKELDLKIIGKSERDYCNRIEDYLIKNHKTILLVLDEIDQLESKNQSVLYTIFEWPSKPNSKLILIGIANALDLTDRILPRLQARCELKPKLLHFPPYTKQQIIEIFTKRLKNAGVLDVFTPTALQMLASKVAAISGDVRRALDIGRRVIELIDKRNFDDKSILKSLENFTENSGLEKVDLKQVVDVLNNVYSTSQNFTNDLDDAFPLQQKLIICTLLLILKKSKNKDVTIGRLHDVYRRVCNKRNIQIIDQSEFSNICILIETRGIIKIIRKKDARLNKINLQWNEDEINRILKDRQLMADILQDDACLGKL